MDLIYNSMTRIEIKPLSVNEAWRGRRYKTDKYKKYERDLLYLLPKTYPIPDGKLQLELTFGFSSKASDLDNGIKQFQDVLSKKYNFNDNRIYKAIIIKEIVPKGLEYVEFEINNLKKELWKD